MRKAKLSLLAIILFLQLAVVAQTDTVPRVLPDTAGIPTVAEQLQRQRDSLQRQADLDQMSRNMDSFVRMQKEREAKQKQQAMIRIGIGVLFLVILVIGVIRRRKAKK